MSWVSRLYIELNGRSKDGYHQSTLYGNTCHNGNSGRFFMRAEPVGGKLSRSKLATLNFRGNYGLDLMKDPPQMVVHTKGGGDKPRMSQ